MKTISFIILFLPSLLYGQENFRNEYTLKGTTVLTGSDKNALSEYVHGYRLSNITSTECQNGGRPEEIKEEIWSISETDSSYSISINIRGNCAHAFLGEIEIKNDSIINLISHGYGGNSTCMCCFGLTYTITFDQTASQKVKYIMINGVSSTIAKIDEIEKLKLTKP